MVRAGTEQERDRGRLRVRLRLKGNLKETEGPSEAGGLSD
jgi:hypothetical protein